MLSYLPISKINLIRLFIQGLILIHIGYTGNFTSEYAYLLLLVTSVSIPLLVPIPDLNKVNISTINYIIQYILFLPYFIYTSYSGLFEKNISDRSYYLLLLSGVIITIYSSIMFILSLIK